MPVLDDILCQKTGHYRQKQLQRHIQTVTPAEGVEVERAGKRLISFSSNDYLGLSQHPRVEEAAVRAIEQYGTGAGASRLVTGNHPLYDALENRLAEWKGTERALIFGSGYLANMGVITALMEEGDLILADKFIHACMIDGAQLSGAKLLRFAHNDMAHAEELLRKHRGQYRNCLLLTESVFSMDGDKAPLSELSALAKTYDAWLMVDDAHNLVPEHEVVDIHTGTLSKMFGSYGGYVCGSAALIEYLTTAARNLIFSTGLPPAVIASATVALDMVMADPTLAEKPLAHARYFTSLLNLPEAQSAIVPLIVGEAQQALQMAKELEEEGFLVTAIRPPTVPEHTARLRVAFSALHTQQQIEQLVQVLQKKKLLAA